MPESILDYMKDFKYVGFLSTRNGLRNNDILSTLFRKSVVEFESTPKAYKYFGDEGT